MPQPDEPVMPNYGCPFCGSCWCDGRRCRKPAAYAADVPLICDPVPGPDGFGAMGQYVVIANRVLTEREVESLREQWRSITAEAGTMLLMPEDVQLVSVFEPRQWPDAEFCAA
jgi:hypothetical protein